MEIIGIILVVLYLGMPIWNTVNLFIARPRAPLWALSLTLLVCLAVLLVAFLEGGTPADEPLVRYEDIGLDGFHDPIAEEHKTTLILFVALGILAFFLLRSIPSAETPPLAFALWIVMILGGGAALVAFLAQVWTNDETPQVVDSFQLFIGYVVLNYLVLAARALRDLVTVARRDLFDGELPRDASALGLVGRCRRALARSSTAPLLVVLLMLPYLAVVVGLLVVLGQEPDSAVRAFTETAGWTFSTQVPPPPLEMGVYDSHYLCTVAAGGTPGVVRPLRSGERHGRPIVVNRQLLVANAFEDLIAERMPRTHRLVRGLYDRHGYPLSTRITTERAANLTYRLMKPAEWAFVAVLYLFDARPETRIARQYLPRTVTP